MKKIIILSAILVLCFALMLPMTASAASATASLTGPGVVRSGDTITLSFNINGSGIFGASGTLSYDTNQVTLTGTNQAIGAPWMVEFNGNNFVAYDNNLTNPINGSLSLFTATFKVNSLATGTNVKISYTGVTASDGSADTAIGTVTYSVAIAPPMSTNNDLASLTVSNATISPAFSATTTSYSASVPFSVSKLNVTATVADGKATVSVNNPDLIPNGTTNVTITVTAENGAKKTYTITVARAQDPNYKPSGNNKLSSITVDGFLLSPAFKSDVAKYVVWLPYETESVKIGGTAADSKASVTVVGGDKLAAGQDNTVKVICTAENGDKKEYIVIVKRAAAHDGTVDTLPPETTKTPETTISPETTKTPETTVKKPLVTSPETTNIPDSKDTAKKGNSAGVVVGVIVSFLCGGAAGVAGIILINKKKR